MKKKTPCSSFVFSEYWEVGVSMWAWEFKKSSQAANNNLNLQNKIVECSTNARGTERLTAVSYPNASYKNKMFCSVLMQFRSILA